MASSRGLEPRFMASKAIVLPLDELELAGSPGLEPGTFALTVRRSAIEL